MNIKLIKTENDYLSSLKRIDELFEAVPNTADGDELELLITLVELYEKNHVGMPCVADALRMFCRKRKSSVHPGEWQ